MAYVDPWGLAGYFTSQEEGDAVKEYYARVSGYTGFEVLPASDGKYVLVDNQEGSFTGQGSDVAYGLVKTIIDMASEVTFVYDPEIAGPEVRVLSDGKMLRPENIDPLQQYENRTSELHFKALETDKDLLDLIYESTHTVTWGLEHYNRILFTESYKAVWRKSERNNVMKQYYEYVAITMFNRVSADLSMGITDSFDRDGYFLNGQWSMYPDGPKAYGRTPFEASGGNAAILRSYGAGIEDYFALQRLAAQ